MFLTHSVTQPSTEVVLFLNKASVTWTYYSIDKKIEMLYKVYHS